MRVAPNQSTDTRMAEPGNLPGEPAIQSPVGKVPVHGPQPAGPSPRRRRGGDRLHLLVVPLLLALLSGRGSGAEAVTSPPPPRAAGPFRSPPCSPEVTAERRLVFRLQAPRAEEVRLQSSDLQGAGLRQPMEFEKDTNGVWSLTVGPVPPGAYRYRFLVDGLPVVDPQNPAVSESNDTVWSLVHVPGSEWFDLREVPHGAVAGVWYRSGTLQRFRRMHVYTPPGYEKGSEQYPVLYLLHGATDSDASWSTVGRAGVILDNLIAAGRARPMIVVMPHGHTGPFRFGMRFTDEFERDFLNDLLPEVERRYRVRSDRAHRAIAGLSMGGMQTLNLLMERPEAFSAAGVFSSGVFGLGARSGPPVQGPPWEERHRRSLTHPELRKGFRTLWFATGREDFLLETSRATVELFKKHGWPVTYKETDGGHTWNNWRDYLVEFVPLLFP